MRLEKPDVQDHRQGPLRFEVLEGAQCHAWLAEHVNRALWTLLYERCPWSTAFQSVTFFEIWIDHYGSKWNSILVLAWRGANDLVGVMPLAARDRIITGVGAHQAEYHGWIYDDLIVRDFPKRTLELLRNRFPKSQILLRYISPRVPVAALEAISRRDPRIAIRRHQCPYMDLDLAAIDEVLKKKGNKSKLNRLKREGELTFRRLSTSDLPNYMDRIAEHCDFRQGAVNDSCPFTDDPSKRAFHLAWFASCPEQFQITGLFLSRELISSTILINSANSTHIGILAHAPEYASQSISKLHFYMAARALAEEGRKEIDMTPGGDAWKERFGNRHETALELISYPTRLQALRIELPGRVERLLRDVATTMGISDERLRLAKNAIQRLKSFKAKFWWREREPPKLNPQIWQIDLSSAPPIAQAVSEEIKINALGDLVRFFTSSRRAERQAVLFDALTRIEAGEACYSIIDPPGNLNAIWLAPGQQEISFDGRIGSIALPEPGGVLRSFVGQGIEAASPSGRKLASGIVQRLKGALPKGMAYLVADDQEATKSYLERLGFRPFAIANSRHPTLIPGSESH